jgi:hypothetical protein
VAHHVAVRIAAIASYFPLGRRRGYRPGRSHLGCRSPPAATARGSILARTRPRRR